MSLPDRFLEELRTRVSIADVVGRKVTWDTRKSNAAKGDFWAPCPFHQEKTASFHVDDQKGYYYCFGCQAKGDAIGFLREAENMGFMEAVECLAQEAGMEMPARDPAAAARAEAGARLSDVVEMAVQFFRLQLSSGAGAPARAYLSERRGLSRDALDRWEIGFAPNAWQGLWDHLSGKGVAGEAIIEAGLAKPSSKGGRPYDVFRNRIMFPIRDARGRAIAFGGRALDPDDTAKYMNSPETPLFDKGRALYNHGPARTAAGKGAPLILAEGYMDVIALSEAGFAGAVAPLGTAVTEHQLALLWRMAEEPVIALDGDAAGLRAAHRLIDLALPQLGPGRSLRFCLFPGGRDPDDLLRAEGPGAVTAALDGAETLLAMVWQRETAGRSFDTPESRAALDRRLRTLVGTIPDPDLRSHYGAALREKRNALFGKSSSGSRRRGRGAAPAAPVAATTASLLAAENAGPDLREAVILALFLRHPALLPELTDLLERLEFQRPEHARLARALLSAAAAEPGALRAAVAAQCDAATVESLTGAAHVRLVVDRHVGEDTERARACITEEAAKLLGERALTDEVAEAEADLDPAHGAPISWRLAQAAEARATALRALAEDRAEYVTAPNGAQMDKAEHDALHALLGQIAGKPEK